MDWEKHSFHILDLLAGYLHSVLLGKEALQIIGNFCGLYAYAISKGRFFKKV